MFQVNIEEIDTELCCVNFYFWKVSLVAPVFKNSWEMSTVESYCPVSLLSVLSKTFEKLVNNRIVDHLEKCDLFSDFQHGFRFSQINCRACDSYIR